jgi:hypothetical protein
MRELSGNSNKILNIMVFWKSGFVFKPAYSKDSAIKIITFLSDTDARRPTFNEVCG